MAAKKKVKNEDEKKFEVTVTRTKVEISVFSVTAEDENAAEEQIRGMLEPEHPEGEKASVSAKKDKEAVEYFDGNLSDSADHTTEFEYEVAEEDED